MSWAPSTPCHPGKRLLSLEEGALSSVPGGPEVTRVRPDVPNYRLGVGSETGAREEVRTESWVSRVRREPGPLRDGVESEAGWPGPMEP